MLLVHLYRKHCAQMFALPTGSMEPTVRPGDRFVVNKLVPIRRWDVVAFYAPEGAIYLKRAVGIPGDTLQIRGEQLFINGQLTPPPPGIGPYLDEEPFTGMPILNAGREPIKLGADEYFFLGDNVKNSFDSRFFRSVEGRTRGAIPHARIVGRATSIYWPPARIGSIR
jgi:signal peptidase I